MMTATCTNSLCKENGVNHNVSGSHEFVECGACTLATTLADERPDPEKIDTFNDTPSAD
jgi:hypothetical protein